MNDEGVVIFCDFDGTVTRKDIVDLMLEAFAEPEWRTVEAQWERGEIDARQCLDRQMRCLRVSEPQLEELVQGVRIDPTFEALALWARDSGVPLVLFSDGFDWTISRVLAHHSLDPVALGIRVFSSHLEFRSGLLDWNFPFSSNCGHGCGTCKPGLMQRLALPPTRRIFIGDGRSDCAAVHVSGTVFAKDWLQQYCRSQGIAHYSFKQFSEVLSQLSVVFSS
jgi:2-hydroxy-3-keto-5-methylthiopentenyl-1-phosphate phosphatase